MSTRKILNRILFGLLFITAGIGYLGNLAGLWSGFTIFFHGWWTMFIILPALFSFVNNGFHFYNTILFMLGLSILLSVNNVYEFHTMWICLLAVTLILIGLRIMFNPIIKKNKFKNFSKEPKTVYVSDDEKESATFTEKYINFDDREFNGIKLESNFASIKLDLRKAIISHDVQIDADANFAGIKIFLPNNVNIQIKSDSAFGSVVNKRRISPITGAPTVFLYANCAFAGIEIF